MERLVAEHGLNGVRLAYEYERKQLANFRQGGPSDAQRVGNRFTKDYRDYATAAIGIYAAAAGIPRQAILEIENIYAKDNSTFDKSENFDWLYGYLPEKTVRNTEIGYRLYQSGKIPSGTKD